MHTGVLVASLHRDAGMVSLVKLQAEGVAGIGA